MDIGESVAEYAFDRWQRSPDEKVNLFLSDRYSLFQPFHSLVYGITSQQILF